LCDWLSLEIVLILFLNFRVCNWIYFYKIIHQLEEDNWKKADLKNEGLQTIFGILLYNSLPIEKDSIKFKFNRIKDTINHIGYFINKKHVEINEWTETDPFIELNYLYTDKLNSLFLRKYRREYNPIRTIKSLEVVVENQVIKSYAYSGKLINFKCYGLNGEIIEEGIFKKIPINSNDTLIDYNPFNYLEKIKLIKEKKVKFGLWKYYDENGDLITEKEY